MYLKGFNFINTVYELFDNPSYNHFLNKIIRNIVILFLFKEKKFLQGGRQGGVPSIAWLLTKGSHLPIIVVLLDMYMYWPFYSNTVYVLSSV